MHQRTLSIVKPDAVENGHTGAILALYEKAGLKLVAARMLRLTRDKAETFYDVHRSRPFFDSLVTYMISGPVLVSVWEGDNAIGKHRELMGATDPAKAADNTVRKLFGEGIERNSVHGSDGEDTAKVEIAHFFAGLDLQDYRRIK
jgi:nucleoside-diphosphate kinase